MLLHIGENRLIGDVQTEFNHLFPYLRLEFFRADDPNAVAPRRFLSPKYSLRYARNNHLEGHITVESEMTVAQLEKEFLSVFGLGVQVQRRSGNLWLDTTMTDNWTLQKQNDHGRELSLTPNKS